MPQKQSAAAQPKQKRVYRKGTPLSDAEKKRRSVARKKETHKELSVFIQNNHKDKLIVLCEEAGVTQARMIELLIDQAACQKTDKNPE